MASCFCCCSSFGIIFLAMLAQPLYYFWMPPQMYEIQGKCALVTGASKGLGVDIARGLAAEGVTKLAITARSMDKLKAVAAKLSQEYPNTEVFVIEADHSKDKDNEEVVKTTLSKFGPSCPLILVQNAGVESLFLFEKATKAKIDSMLDINLKAPIYLLHGMLPSMIKSSGHVVFINSVGGKLSLPGMNIYSASKFGLAGFAWGLRNDMKARDLPVTIHSIHPGWVRGEGMAVDIAKQIGMPLNILTDAFGYSDPPDTAAAVIEAIKYNHPEIIVNKPVYMEYLPMIPFRLLHAVGCTFPRFFDKLLYLPLPGFSKVVDFLLKAAEIQTQS